VCNVPTRSTGNGFGGSNLNPNGNGTGFGSQWNPGSNTYNRNPVGYPINGNYPSNGSNQSQPDRTCVSPPGVPCDPYQYDRPFPSFPRGAGDFGNSVIENVLKNQFAEAQQKQKKRKGDRALGPVKYEDLYYLGPRKISSRSQRSIDPFDGCDRSKCKEGDEIPVYPETPANPHHYQFVWFATQILEYPTTLTRVSTNYKNKVNLEQGVQFWGNIKTGYKASDYPVPGRKGEDHQWDEYPYTATLEGGFKSIFASIPRSENASEGGKLGAWLNANVKVGCTFRVQVS
jgi:hypothetical protein